MLDDLFLVTSGEYNSYSLHHGAADGSWIFAFSDNPKNRTHLPDQILLTRQEVPDTDHLNLPTDRHFKNIQVESGYTNLLYSFSSVSIILPILLIILLILFLRFGPRFFTMLVNRIFLLNFLPKGDFIRGTYDPYANNSWLKQFFTGDYRTALGFKRDRTGLAPVEDQELYILRLTIANSKTYQMIWETLKPEEQYLIFDFALDGYTNYKDTLTIYKLLQKGIVVYNNNELKFFQLSFRNFLLTKRGTDEIDKLKNKYSVPGIWQTIRIPALIVIAVSAIFLLLTQENISHRLAGLITSVGAIIPLVMEITKRAATKGT
jgi:hypothetical protein